MDNKVERTINKRGLNPGIKGNNTRFVRSPQLLSATFLGMVGGTSCDLHVDAWQVYRCIYVSNSVERFGVEDRFLMFVRVEDIPSGGEVAKPKKKSG